jgi:hypothetical protein
MTKLMVSFRIFANALKDAQILYFYLFLFILFIYLLQMGFHPVAVHIYTQTIHRTTQITTEQHK